MFSIIIYVKILRNFHNLLCTLHIIAGYCRCTMISNCPVFQLFRFLCIIQFRSDVELSTLKRRTSKKPRERLARHDKYAAFYDIFNHVEGDRFALEFCGRALGVHQTKRKKKNGSEGKLRKSRRTRLENSTEVLSF